MFHHHHAAFPPWPLSFELPLDKLRITPEDKRRSGSGAQGQRLPNFYTWREPRAPPVIFQPPVSQPADLPTCVGGLPCQRERYGASCPS